MRKCHRCGTQFTARPGQPRTRDVCDGCGAYLHNCLNCHHFDRVISNSCTLPHTKFVGGRDMLNYCDDFKMLNHSLRVNEDRAVRARTAWDQLFKR